MVRRHRLYLPRVGTEISSTCWRFERRPDVVFLPAKREREIQKVFVSFGSKSCRNKLGSERVSYLLGSKRFSYLLGLNCRRRRPRSRRHRHLNKIDHRPSTIDHGLWRQFITSSDVEVGRSYEHRLLSPSSLSHTC